ncbi:MAG: metallophosphoesterase [Chitinophagaceae bacterium]|nr:metallophosphoesterase [Rubrivivax sp.]
MLLHLSDPHFGTERPQVVEALVRLAHAQQPQVVVLSGDITQRARRVQFRAARAFVDRLSAPNVVVIPGNHDVPLFNMLARVVSPYAGVLREFKPLEPVLDTPELLLVSVKTTRRYRHTNGEVSKAQIDAVAQRLRGARERQLRIVVVHQPIEVLRAEDEHDRLRGHEAATRCWAEAGADLVLGGHIHLPYVLPLHERLPGLARRVWAVQAGTAVSQRVREGISNSVNLLRWGGPLPAGRCVVERWDYLASADAFSKALETTLDTGLQ